MFTVSCLLHVSCFLSPSCLLFPVCRLPSSMSPSTWRPLSWLRGATILLPHTQGQYFILPHPSLSPILKVSISSSLIPHPPIYSRSVFQPPSSLIVPSTQGKYFILVSSLILYTSLPLPHLITVHHPPGMCHPHSSLHTSLILSLSLILNLSFIIHSSLILPTLVILSHSLVHLTYATLPNPHPSSLLLHTPVIPSSSPPHPSSLTIPPGSMATPMTASGPSPGPSRRSNSRARRRTRPSQTFSTSRLYWGCVFSCNFTVTVTVPKQ